MTVARKLSAITILMVTTLMSSRVINSFGYRFIMCIWSHQNIGPDERAGIILVIYTIEEN